MKKSPTKYTEEDKLRLLREYHESGMSKNHFAKTHGLCNLTLLNSWLRRYGPEENCVSLPPESTEDDMANRSKDDYRQEIDAQKKRIKELEKALEFSRLETKARDMIIDKAEEYFDIQIRKKSGGQVATELVSKEYLKVSLVCRLFGHCRQAFYQSEADIEKDVNRERQIVKSVRDIRTEDPGIGAYKLWLMMTDMYGRNYVMGRDRFFVVLRRHGLMLPPPKPRHTTNSNHRYHKWKNLIKDIVLTAANYIESILS
jgi:transposase-like protein